MDTPWIKFPCNLLQYEKLPLVELKREYGLVTKYHNKSCVVGSLDSRYENRNKEVSYTQAVGIMQHILEKGLVSN